MIDVSVTHPSSPSLCQGAASKPLSAAGIREKQKIAKYDRLAKLEECRFVPFVLESFGSYGNIATKFVREIRQSSVEPHASPMTGAYVTRILAIALQAGNAFTLLSGCLQAREWSTALRRQRAHIVERVDRESDEEEEVKAGDFSDDDEENIGQVISLQPDIQSSSVVSETSSSPSENENNIGSAGDLKKDGEIPATQEEVEEKSKSQTDSTGAVVSEDKQATNGVTSESKDVIVSVVEGLSEEVPADSASEEIVIFHDEDGIRSPTQSPIRSPIRSPIQSPTRSPDPNPKRQRRNSE